MARDLNLAPPATRVDDLLAVPIDITYIDAVWLLDAEAQTASGDATLHYIVGRDAGNPIFDLRQRLTHAWLDDEPLALTRLAHHAFGAGPYSDLRVLEAVQAAGSAHALRLQYALDTPDVQPGGARPPGLTWEPGRRLRFALGLSDRQRAGYLESWLPANLIFDQFALRLELRLVGTPLAHSLLTNGRVAVLGPNHWSVEFPSHFSALSPMLELRASDTLTARCAHLVLPASGKSVSIEAWKPAGSSVDLSAELGQLERALADADRDFGPYPHADRFIALFEGPGGVACEGGALTSSAALAHQVRHSWFGRGVKPASSADAWWCESFTAFWERGVRRAIPFDFQAPPRRLYTRSPWQRGVAVEAATDGMAFWQGLASLLGLDRLRRLMAELFEAYRGQAVSTPMLEELLLARSGNPSVLDAFHRFVYGLPDGAPAPELWLRDAVEDRGGDHFSGAFWNSPDLWVRNQDDGGIAHQEPDPKSDNWFYARVRNKPGAGHAAHFIVAFQASGAFGSSFVYPLDFLPCTAAKLELDLAPGEARIVRARWPRELVPPEGTATSILASIITRADHPVAGRHAWEHNNLAQKSSCSLRLAPGERRSLPIVLGNWLGSGDTSFDLELALPARAPLEVSLSHRTREFFRDVELPVRELERPRVEEPGALLLDCGGSLPGSAAGRESRAAPPESRWQVTFSPAATPVLPIALGAFTQTQVELELLVHAAAQPTNPIEVHLMQRNRRTRQLVGGVVLVVSVRAAP